MCVLTSDLASLHVPNVDALILVQRDGLAPQHHLHCGRRDVLHRPPQHPAVTGATQHAGGPPRALGPLAPRLLFSLFIINAVLEAAGRKGEGEEVLEEEEGDKG